MKLLLSSCDFGHPESAEFIYTHLEKPISDCRVLFFPNEKAAPEKIHSGKYETRLSAFGFRREHITVADYFSSVTYTDSVFDIVYISGGNTFGTMKRIRDAGFDGSIRYQVANGAVYIGGSAGAHIASADISHVLRYDKDSFGLTDFRGLALCHGILICHFSEEREKDFEELNALGRYPVTTLKDGESIAVGFR